MCDDFSAYRQRGYDECGYCAVIVVRLCSSNHNIYVFGVYWYPGLSDSIFDGLLTAKVQSVGRNRPFFSSDFSRSFISHP